MLEVGAGQGSSGGSPRSCGDTEGSDTGLGSQQDAQGHSQAFPLCPRGSTKQFLLFELIQCTRVTSSRGTQPHPSLRYWYGHKPANVQSLLHLDGLGLTE